ncbi:MAG TPA: hypothetical protein VGH13_13200 [Xanthobacteraceae bacterium]|jgi:hypothetical protein
MTACDESANQEFQDDIGFDIINATSAPRSCSHRACGPEFAFIAFKYTAITGDDMPNRGELPNPRRAKDTAAPGPSDAWPIICFCTAGALMSIYMAVSYAGIDAVPRPMSQFPGG